MQDAESLKVVLIDWLSELKGPEVLRQLSAIKDGQDWWETISNEEKSSVEKGLTQLDRGEGIPHQKVISEMRAKYQL